MRIERYTPANKEEWDMLVMDSKIDSFLFLRDFMDYHSHRFFDCSFMIYLKNKLEAVLPGNIDDATFYSHQGLTYGGLVCSKQVRGAEVISIFTEINLRLRSLGIRDVIYKPAPSIYHKLPAQEDLYALFTLEAKKIACNLSSTIRMSERVSPSNLRIRGAKKATREGLIVKESDDFVNFWKILQHNLQERHNSSPVHSLHEIMLLKERFSNQIKLFIAAKDNEMLGGCVLFIMQDVVHVQYIAANDQGKDLGALDILLKELIEKYSSFSWFDFGISTEKMGNILNEKLLFQKEGFGARGIVYDTYLYSLL